MTRLLIFFFLALTAFPFPSLLRGGRVHSFIGRMDRTVQSAVYRVNARFDFSLLPNDSN